LQQQSIRSSIDGGERAQQTPSDAATKTIGSSTKVVRALSKASPISIAVLAVLALVTSAINDF
jgi:hypothetical protein